MPNMTGVVESMGKDGKRFKIDDEWYSAFSASQVPPAVCVGAVVTFTYVLNGTFRNIKGNVGVDAAGADPAAAVNVPKITGSGPSAPSAYGGKTFPVHPLHPDRSIIRQNSLTHATKVVMDAPQAENMEATAVMIITVARIFEAYSSGDADQQAANEAVKVVQATEE